VLEVHAVPDHFRKCSAINSGFNLRPEFCIPLTISFPSLIALVLLYVCFCGIVQILSLLQTLLSNSFFGVFLISSTLHLNSNISGTNLWFPCILCVSAHVFHYNYLHTHVIMCSLCQASWDVFCVWDTVWNVGPLHVDGKTVTDLASSGVNALKILLQGHEREKFCEVKAEFENTKFCVW